jgi:DNA-binding NtrC family response regulator
VKLIKIEFSGTGEEARNEMLKLLGLHEPEIPMEPKVPAKSQQVTEIQPKLKRVRQPRKKAVTASTASASWTEEEVTKLFNETRSNAQKILVELANKPEGYQKKELATALGIDEESLRGQLSSVGAALKRMGVKFSPLSREKIDGELTYKLDPAVASVLKQQQI